MAARGEDVAQLDGRPALPAGRVRPPARPRRAGRGGCSRRRGGPQGQRRRRRPLLHRGGADRRHDDRHRRAERHDRRRPRLGPGQGRRPARFSPTSTRSCTGSAWRWRTSATSTARRSPGRSPPAPTAPARSCATSPPRSRRWSWSCADGSVRELDAADARAAARGAGRHRRPRRDLGGDAALRPRLRARADRLAAAARGGARQLRAAGRGQRPLRALHLPLRRLGAGPGAQPRRGAAAAARPARRLPQRHRARELGAGGALGGRQAVPAGDPRRSPGSPPRSPPAAARSTAATGSSPASAASASPRWSTGCRASTGPRRRGG